MRINFIQMLLQQRLLGKNGIFDNQLEQAGDVVGIQMVLLPHQALQQIAFAVDITHRTVRCQLGFTHLNSQSAAFCQQRKQFLIQGAYLIAQSQ
jgi:hypothetical protein